MATRWYTKTAQYTLPAWNLLYFAIDGMYIDGYLFENNVTVLDNILWLSIKPTASHIVGHGINFSLPSFNGTTVKFLYKAFTWLPFQDHAQSDKIFCNGQPYGMGVNTLGVSMAIIVGGIIANPIIYDVSFIMEVTV